MKILWHYILKRHIAPFIFSVIVLMFVFLLQFLMRFLDQLAGKGLSAMIIAEFIFLNLAHMIVLAIPMSVLIATIMAYGGLASNNEISAMRAGGVSLYRMMAPAFSASILLCLFLIYFFNEILPDANYRAKMLTSDIYRKKPTLTLVPGLFSRAVQGYGILVSKTYEYSNDLEGITIIDFSNPSINRTVTAKSGAVSFSPDYRRLIMDLYDGEINEANMIDFKQYRNIRFTKHRIAMATEGFEFIRTSDPGITRGDRELSASDMQRRVDSLQRYIAQIEGQIDFLYKQHVQSLFKGEKSGLPSSSPHSRTSAFWRYMNFFNTLENSFIQLDFYERQIREYRVEIHKKYAIPVACLVFVLIGAPLGVMSRRGTFGMAASLSLGFFTLYWACLILGEKFADRGYFDPWLGMWIANMVIGTFGIYLTIRIARESLVIDWNIFQKFIPKRWRQNLNENSTLATPIPR